MGAYVKWRTTLVTICDPLHATWRHCYCTLYVWHLLCTYFKDPFSPLGCAYINRMPPTLMFCLLYLYRMNEIEISLFDPFKPMLADRPPASFDFDAVRTNQVWPLKQFHWFFTAWFFTHFCLLKISQGTPPDGVPWRSAQDKIEIRSFSKHSTLENTTVSVIDLTFF